MIKNYCDVILSEESFTYDAAGNVTDTLDSCFAYDTNNRLTSFNGNAVSYDLDGNMLSNGSLSCTYDSANRLISAGGHTYTYNAEDVRIRNLCEDEDTTYTYNTNAKLSMLLMKTTDGAVTKYVYGKGLIGEESNNTFKTYHFDARGSTIAITDACGNITDTFAYDTYGKLLSRTGTSKIIFGYNGRDGVVTEDNGLIYMRARYYSPEMKRFINADIVAGQISNAVTLNRFAYANGNPAMYIDSIGLFPVPIITNNPAMRPINNYQSNGFPVIIQYNAAIAMGQRADISEGVISINMVEEEKEIEMLSKSLGLDNLCDILASTACDKYYEINGEEFLLSDECVSNEIKDHIIAYEWSVGKRAMPNILAAAFTCMNIINGIVNSNKKLLLDAITKQTVYNATQTIDMREVDVRADSDWKSQASFFHYKEGIRDIYVGTERDPWASERK